MPIFRIFVAAIALLFLTACVSLNTVRTMQAFSNINPTEDEIGEFIFGVMASPKLKVQNQTSNFYLQVAANGGAPVQTKFAIEQMDVRELSLSSVPRDKNRVLTVFQLTDDGKKRVREHQALIRDMKAKGTKGSFGIGVNPDFCKTGPVDYAREKFSIFIAKNKSSDLMPLIENMSLKDLLKKANKTEIRDC
jgi:hypothetical protein